jgi:hypothetical protein
MIILYNGSGKLYQTILPIENDITYNDLIKYIQIQKHSEFDEIDFNKKISDTVFVKTSIILFDYVSHNQIKLNDDIDKNELLVMFNYKYYIFSYYYDYYELINDIKKYDNIFDAIKSNPYKLIFIDPQIENYEEICKLAVQQNGNALAYVKNQTDEICKLAVKQDAYAFRYVKEQTDEICKLAVQQKPYALEYVKNQTKEICKLAVQQNGSALYYVKNQTEEICKLAVKLNCYTLEYVRVQTEELCQLAVQQNYITLQYVKKELQTEEICKIAIKQNGYALRYIKDTVMREKISNLL